MRIKNNFPLHILDRYAKTITTRQKDMLYENRNGGKKHKKMLCEADVIDEEDYYKIFVSDYNLQTVNMTKTQLIDKFSGTEGYDGEVKYRVSPTGVYLYTESSVDYEKLLGRLEAEGGFDLDKMNKDAI